jgi:short-subunit dehydrogenase
MEVQKQGNIVFIASVAADRGRPSNYAYGSSKAAVVTFLQGMRARLAKSNVHVMTVKPGFVESPMTEHIEGSGPLWSTPEKVAEIIQKGLVKRRNTLYTPWFWWGIMTIIKSIPECIFKKLNL